VEKERVVAEKGLLVETDFLKERVMASGMIEEPILQSVQCPYCWHEFPSSEVLYIAQHGSLKGDPVLGKDEFLRFLPTRYTVHGDGFDAENTPCRELACPRCHLLIPRALVHHPNIIFSMIGGPRTGKSYFLTSLTWQLKQHLPEFGYSFEDLDVGLNELLLNYQHRFFAAEDVDKLIQIEKTDMDLGDHYRPTRLNQQDVQLPVPFIFQLSPMQQSSEFDSMGSRILCFYDNAGEHFFHGQDSSVNPGTRHLSQASVLLFLFDPCRDSRFRQRCRQVSEDPQLYGTHTTIDQGSLLVDAINRIRTHAHLSTTEIIKRPLLLLISKSDIWKRLLPELDMESSPYGTDPVYGRNQCLNVNRIEQVSHVLTGFMRTTCPDIMATAERNFASVTCIPISALGTSPEEHAGAVDAESKMLLIKPRNIHPRWVTVPLLYPFAKFGRPFIRSMEMTSSESESPCDETTADPEGSQQPPSH
jgi:hypothetical protein